MTASSIRCCLAACSFMKGIAWVSKVKVLEKNNSPGKVPGPNKN